MQGNRGNDVFVLQPGNGESIIQDFQSGRDRIGLNKGLSFSRLSLSQEKGNVLISKNGDRLATIRGEQLNRLSQEDFIKL